MPLTELNVEHQADVSDDTVPAMNEENDVSDGTVADMNDENGHDFLVDDETSDDDIEPRFEIMSLTANERKTAISFVPYCREWFRMCGIEIKQRKRVERAFDKKAELSLPSLFMNGTFFESVRKWTTQKMRLRGLLIPTNVLTIEKLYAYVGLEMAMSLCKFNQISDYWCGKTFHWKPRL